MSFNIDFSLFIVQGFPSASEDWDIGVFCLFICFVLIFVCLFQVLFIFFNSRTISFNQLSIYPSNHSSVYQQAIVGSLLTAEARGTYCAQRGE